MVNDAANVQLRLGPTWTWIAPNSSPRAAGAAISPHDAWVRPILRAIDTGVGIALGLAGSSIVLRLTQAHHRRR